MTPTKPADLDARTAALLDWMGAQPWASCLVLGGALALKHYVNIRPTHDCDAWWTPAATTADKAQVLSAVESFLARQAPAARIVRQRWGDVDSVKVLEQDRAVFSFQIADRSVQLEPYQPSGWGGLKIESFTDNVASKMCALVERGAPRDFIDIYHVAQATGRTPAELWNLWQRKNPDRAVADALALVRLHLEGLARRRPLESILDANERENARKVRDWFWRSLLTHEPGN
jgi:hypothetical protein